jgi:hypothetical protein
VSSQKGREDVQNDKRNIFDWTIFLLIHAVLIGGISVAGFYVYGFRLGAWVAASALIAGFASAYLFAQDIPGETFMKCLLGVAVAANAAYLVHNGAQAMGVDAYNKQQIEKFERGMAEAGKSASRRVARELRLGAEAASKLDKAFSDGVALWAALLAFAELGLALIIFAIAARRQKTVAQPEQDMRYGSNPAPGLAYARHMRPRLRPGYAPASAENDVKPTGRLEAEMGKGNRRNN